MTRPRSDTNADQPSQPVSENTTNRQYFGTSSMIDAPDQDVEEASSASSSEKASPTRTSSKHVRTKSTSSAVEVEHEATPSPTASDILNQCDPEDMIAMGNLDRQARDKGMKSKERKKLLLEKQEEMRTERDREAQEEQNEREKRLDAEFDTGVGKGKGKTVMK